MYEEIWKDGVLVDRIWIDNGLTLQQAIEQRLSEISQTAKQLQDAAIEQYSAGEMTSWLQKEADARAVLAGASASPLHQTEANEAGISALDLAEKIVAKADEFHVFSRKVAGTRSRHQRAISALQNVEEVQAYVVDGWPELG